ncbi:MAG TPA: hypothetical protein VJA47_00880 [archaeon]|nr:hypothetical protein [archaeon]
MTMVLPFKLVIGIVLILIVTVIAIVLLTSTTEGGFNLWKFICPWC